MKVQKKRFIKYILCIHMKYLKLSKSICNNMERCLLYCIEEEKQVRGPYYCFKLYIHIWKSVGDHILVMVVAG